MQPGSAAPPSLLVMKFAIVGSGAVGGYYGAKLAQPATT